jgi:hypothetical protein
MTMLLHTHEGYAVLTLGAKRSYSHSLVVAFAARSYLCVVSVQTVVYHDGARWLGWSGLVSKNHQLSHKKKIPLSIPEVPPCTPF